MDTGDSSADETNNLVLDEEHPSGGGRSGKKYVVSGGGFPGRRRFSRNQWICIGVGVALVVVLIVVVGGGIGAWYGRERSESESSEGELWKNIRLPSSITPEDYTTHLTADIDKFSVTGMSTITLNVHTQTNLILFHIKQMNISSFSVSQNGLEIAVTKNFTYEENNFYVIELASKLAVGVAQLVIDFDYILGEGLVGFYRSSYVDSDGAKKWIGTTFFEPTDARKAFPCFDEPAMKANFTFSITHSSGLNAHSNMPVSGEDTSEDGLTKTTHFYTSVKMSTYLVAFVVSDFACISNLTTSGINVSVCSNPAVVHNTQYALEKAVEILEYYEGYFNVTYPLPKQDLFAIPDFSAGAMENWGLITYRETALLYNPATNPESSKERVAIVIAHELAHQWFGNLVTMEWWDGLWLNEGFATFTEYIGTDATEPSFHILEKFLTDDVFVALAADGVNETHPIIQTVSNPDEINELFDSISYSKGGSVLRMIRNVLTTAKFQLAITRYLEKSKFGNAVTEQLWEALQTVVEESNELNVTEFMDTWTLQMGYPIVTVDTKSGKVTQERFFIVQPNGTIAPSPYGYVWMIPFNYVTEQNSSEQFLMNNLMIISEKEETVKFPANSGFVLVNVNRTGFYRVNYDLSNWYDIITHLRSNPNSQIIKPGDRAGLISDVFALSSARILDIRLALNLTLYIKDETEYAPIATALSSLATIGTRLSLTPLYGQYQEFMRNLTSGLVARLPFNSTDLSHLNYYIRADVLNIAWFNGNKDVINTASQLFQDWMKYNITVDPDLKTVVYSVGIAFGGEEEWEFVWQQYMTSSDSYEKRLFLSALGKSPIPWILNRYLEYAIDESKVRTQDVVTVIAYVSNNINGRYLAWNFVRNNWSFFSNRYGGGSFSFSRLIKYVTGHFSSEVELEEVERFFEEQKDHGSGERAIKQVLETIKLNILWLQTNKDILQTCLSDTKTCFSASSSSLSL